MLAKANGKRHGRYPRQRGDFGARIGLVITPSQTAALPKRIAASAVDLAIVGLLWLLVLYRLAVRFEIAQRTPEGEPVYSEFQRQKLLEIDDGINFGFTLGDYYHSLHGRGLVLGALALLIFSLIAWVLIPANTGWSVGHRLLGLRVTDLKGERPPLDSYLRRYLVGLVDLFPYVVPGLLGWVVASRNERHQRMGDISADTVVIPAEVLTGVPRTTAGTTAPASKTTDLHTMVDVEEAIAGATSRGTTTGGDYPVVEVDDVIPSTAGPATSVSTSEDELTSIITDQPAAGQEPSAGMSDSGWLFPESQDAPVWTPEPSSERGPQAPAVEQAAPATDAETGGELTGRGIGGEPVWNEEWGAWLFWDTEGKRWLRHDETTGWLPLEDSQNVS